LFFGTFYAGVFLYNIKYTKMDIETIYNEIVKGYFTIVREYNNTVEIKVGTNIVVLWFGNNYINGITFDGQLKIIDDLKEAKIIYETYIHKNKYNIKKPG